MAVVTSGSGQESSGFVRVTGLVKVKDVMINPTLEEMQEYGITWLQNEPDYFFENEEHGQGVSIDIYFKLDPKTFKESDKVPEIIMNKRVFLLPAPRKGQSGSYQWINKYGNTSWAEEMDGLPDWFSKDGVRKAYIGEEELISFIKAWSDWRKNDECTLDTMEAILKGNFKELKELYKSLATHKLKVWVGLKDSGNGRFNHVVYPKLFMRVYSNDIYMDKKNVNYKQALPILVKQPYMEFKQADVISYEPKIWTSQELSEYVVQPDEDVQEVDLAQVDDVSAFSAKEDDLPF